MVATALIDHGITHVTVPVGRVPSPYHTSPIATILLRMRSRPYLPLFAAYHQAITKMAMSTSIATDWYL